MKILTYDEFVVLPSGTLFSYYEPTLCAGLLRKGKTIYDGERAIDYFKTSLVPVSWNGEEPPTLEATETRWAEYERSQLYAVLDPADIQTLRSLIPPP